MATPVIFLDGASQPPGQLSRADAEVVAKSLIANLIEIRKLNKRIALNTEVPIAHCKISENWTFQVIFGGNKFKEEWDFIRLLNSYSPLSAGFENLLGEISDKEFRTLPSNILSVSAAWAKLFDTMTISFVGHQDWSESWLELTYSELEEDDTITEANCRIRNACRNSHLIEHRDWVRLLGLSDNPTSQELWDDRSERFPGLIFCDRVRKDLEDLQGSTIPFSQMLSSLGSLNDDSVNWDSATSSPTYSTRTTAEFQTRQGLCWFHDSTTVKNELFEWHTRFTGGIAGRIHFRLESAKRKIIIGYIGAKL